MTDIIIVLMLAVFGIIGYLVMSGIDGYIDRHVTDRNEQWTEPKTDEYAETGAPKHTHSGMPVIVFLKRKSHSRSI